MEPDRSALGAYNLVHSLSYARNPTFIPGSDDLVAFRLQRADEATDSDQSRLIVLSRSSGEQTSVTTEDFNVSHFSYQSDRNRVALIGPGGHLHLARVSPTGEVSSGATIEGTQIFDVEDTPTWSPAQDRLALTLRPPAPHPSAPQIVTGSHFKEDGYGFIGQARRQVLLYDTASGVSIARTAHGGGTNLPAWSEDGALVAVRQGDEGGWPWATVSVLDAVTGDVRASLRTYRGTVDAVTFLDPNSILFVGSERRPWTNQTDVFLWRWETDELTPIVTDLPWQLWVLGFHASRSPLVIRADRNEMLVSGIRHGRSGLYSIDLRTGLWNCLYESFDLRGGLALSTDGRHAIQELSSLNSVGELVEVELETGEERALTDFNCIYFAQRQLEVNRLKIVTPSRAVDAWVLTSGDVDESAPVVFDIHGGPHNFYGEYFLPEHQLLAVNGSPVVYCNPLGSSSYDTEFTSATSGHWGSDDTNDLLAVLSEALVILGSHRPVVVSGWSYGGFQVLNLIGRNSELFDAAICGAPAADFISWFGTTDAPNMVKEELQGCPDQRQALYMQQSPIHRLIDCKIPVLLLHGTDDMRSPIGQTEIVHRILSEAGCPVRYVRYPQAAHAFRHVGRPSQRAHVLGEILNWVASVKADGGSTSE